ncbi:potassium-transporting ATPase subunit KdpC [uncultured Phenylobacterium sp.]|uniref:potassium-transporting ATPase subunit KdpC n=1 Tax=uncultured Phenylobacterium sp. TaxID=349273 RepID=UPI0025ECC4E6|nr:potassium-transporting ATPase subunit KdpC [uncultured Phenylobacterium sp.]
MFALVRPAVVSLGLFTVLLGLAYPLAITGLAQGAFPHQANGSVVRVGGTLVGSELIGQTFTGPQYLHGRPSAAGSDGYDASASSGSNLGPLNEALAKRIQESAVALKAEAGAATIPGDAVTTSASGLDPHISPANADMQAGRIAAARGAPVEQVRALIGRHVEDRTFGILGQPRVNVLKTNLALDAAWPKRQPPPQ